MAAEHRIEVVRGDPDVLCVVRGEDGSVLGANAVQAEDVELVSGRRFWMYRRWLADGVTDDVDTLLLNAAFDVLDAEHAGDDGDPVGLCALIEDRELLRRHPEAIWPATGMIYVGYLPDGRQVRIRYFTEARI